MGRISVLLGSVVLMLAVSGSIASAAKPGAGDVLRRRTRFW